MRTVSTYLDLALSLLIASVSSPVGAVIVPGQVDDFEDGGFLGWQAGQQNRNGPANIASGGPAGLDDNYLLLASDGSGSGGRLVAFNGNQWAGDYLSAAVGSIRLQVNNLGATDLVLRLILEGAGQNLGTLSSVNVPAGSGWTTVSFSLAAENLAGGNYHTVLSSVATLDLVHSPNAITSRQAAPTIIAKLGVDNMTAVPEKAPSNIPTIPIWGLGLLTLLVACIGIRRMPIH
jgi:hypothetical protein